MDAVARPAEQFAEPLAWWSGHVCEILIESDQSICGKLSIRAREAHRINEVRQLDAWRSILSILRNSVADLPGDWRVLLEYPLIRLRARLDVVLVTDRAIIVIEFKCLGSKFEPAARRQAEDYALDLRDFHAASRNRVIVPIVVASFGQAARWQWDMFHSDVSGVYEALPDDLPDLLKQILGKISYRDVDIPAWEHAPYRPVPSIIEAAMSLYRKHGVDEIRNARADTDNLTKTTQAILRAIDEAKMECRFTVLFVTGIPGAGKTLCGLDAVFASEDSTFLTGTWPMVYVLNAAIAKDADEKRGKKKRVAVREAKSKIQSVTGFLKTYILKPVDLPEHVIVFDEAQRAWDARQGKNSSFKLPDSEASIILDIMRRHEDYAVIVCLVGNGQEINKGEAGLAEWGRALEARPSWHVRAAKAVIHADKNSKQRLFQHVPEQMVFDDALHLSVGLRNVKSAAAARWVEAVLQGDAVKAREIIAGQDLFWVTRSLEDMRAGLRVRARGLRRCGLVCSSGAKRLVADGIWPNFAHMDQAKVANWFLLKWPDVRASDALEVPATEFACQGLELDYVGLCWGGDLTRTDRWEVRTFAGNDWNQCHKKELRDFQVNTYRVLLTRARYETIIWVPRGDRADKTRDPERFDRTVEFLVACGVRALEVVAPELAQEESRQLF